MGETDAISEFGERLVADVVANAEADSVSTPEAFTRRVTEDLEQAGETENTFLAHHAARGVEVSGYAANDSLDSLDLFVTHFRQRPERLTPSQVDTYFRRLRTYLIRCRDGLARQLDDTTDVYEMTSAVAKHAAGATRVRLFLLTNAVTSVGATPDDELDGLPVSHHVWDLRRLERLASSGTQSEPVDVEFDPPLPCLGASGTDDDFRVLLAILPGTTLARLYGTYGTRLLQLNVRSFLQGRGAVNKGIRQTLQTEPERFLAYNNGVTATASRVEFADDHSQLVRKVHDLQIVNGGQTTASLHYAHVRDRVDLTRVQVQMKLTVVTPENLRQVVPEISRYSNTQNKVTVVDFSSNHPFHVAVEKNTRTLRAPASARPGLETRWFNERARGQYADALARERTPANQRRFRVVHPTAQKFTKSDAAKFVNSWHQLPHVVSRGAEKNFRAYMAAIGEHGPTVDVTLCQRLVATAILFRETDRIVAAQDFGGYKINIVAYTVAKLAQATGQRVNLDRLWHDQKLSTALRAALESLCAPVHDVITHPRRGTNVGEWAKHEDCWARVCDISWTPGRSLLRELTDDAVLVAAADTADPGTATTNSEPGQLGPPEVWFALIAWARETHNLTLAQRQLAATVGRSLEHGRRLSDAQAGHALRALEQARALGFRHAAQ